MAVERNLSVLPKSLIVGLVICVALQFMATWFLSKINVIQFTQLKAPSSVSSYQILSLGSQSLMGQLLTLKLQLHDNQQGRHVNYKKLDYKKITKWLVLLQEMNLSSEYPALLASRVFSNTSNKDQLRKIIEIVIVLFENEPKINWRWMAEGAVIAKYHLKDLQLALKMAKLLAKQPKSLGIPAWARDLEFIMLEELNMIDSAIYIVEQSLKDQSTMHPDEKRFLKLRLSVLKQKSVENQTR